MKRRVLYLSFFVAPATLLGADALWFNIRRAQRRIAAHAIKSAVSHFDETKPLPVQPKNLDEQRYSDKRGNFNKALRHRTSGFPHVAAYASLVHAVETGDPADFNKILLGGARKMGNPQGAFVFDLPSNDAWINAIPAAPAFDSAETAGEMVENYWTVLLRDVPFNEFDTNVIAQAAIDDLNNMSDFRGPKVGGVVTSGTLLRGNAPGELTGPYVSQFLYRNIPFGVSTISPSFPQPTAVNFITTLADWQIVANGNLTGASITTGASSFIRTPRDLTEYVRKDQPCTPGIATALILNSFGAAALDPANPYIGNATQDGFVTFGISELLTLVQEASHAALKATWYHKWQFNRRLRPEEFGFYVHQQKMNGMALGIHPDLLNSAVLPLILANNPGTYLLSQAYPEGSPIHPSYPAGHAAFIGSAVTILKAWFNENFVIPNPVEPNAGNTLLVPYAGNLTIGHELNKLASNISLARDHAGVHYRSDGWQGMLLGEKVAIDILNNRSFLFNENFAGFSLTTFEGKKITVGGKRRP